MYFQCLQTSVEVTLFRPLHSRQNVTSNNLNLTGKMPTLPIGACLLNTHWCVK